MRRGGGGVGGSTANPVGAETVSPSAASQKLPIPVLRMAVKWFSTREKQPCKLPLCRRFALFMVTLIDPATRTARVVCRVPMIVVHQGGKMGEKNGRKKGAESHFIKDNLPLAVLFFLTLAYSQWTMTLACSEQQYGAYIRLIRDICWRWVRKMGSYS